MDKGQTALREKQDNEGVSKAEKERLQSLRLANESLQIGRESLAVIGQQSGT